MKTPTHSSLFFVVPLAVGVSACPSGSTNDASVAMDAMDVVPQRESAVPVEDTQPTLDTAPAQDSEPGPESSIVDAAPEASVVDVPRMPSDPLAGIGRVERVRNMFMFTEGPQWFGGDLLFSDIPANTIYRLNEPMTFSVFRMPSDNSNGLAVDRQGRLYAAEHGSRSVTRTRPDGTRETIASHFTDGGMRLRLNSPNDLIVRSDGTVYFTDPPYGINTAQQELSFNGVFRLAPNGTLTTEWRGPRTARPNGIALTLDERTLYVADTADGYVRSWTVQADGSLTNERMLVRTSGNPDGMAIDREGNLFVTTNSGVQVFSPEGRLWGTISVPEQPANCAFGGSDSRTLYITARMGLYRVRLAQPGLP